MPKRKGMPPLPPEKKAKPKPKLQRIKPKPAPWTEAVRRKLIPKRKRTR